MPDVEKSNDRVKQNSTAAELAPESVFDLQDIWKLPGAFLEGLTGLGDSETAKVTPDLNQSNDKGPQNSSIQEVVPETEARNAYAAFLDEVLEYPKAIAVGVIEGVDGFFDWLDSEGSEVEETDSSGGSPEESEIEEKEVEKARNSAEPKTEAEKSGSGAESKTGSAPEASETGRRPVEITVKVIEGSVIEEGKRHSVTPGEFIEFFKEVEIKGFGTKVLVDTRTGTVSTVESSSNGSMSLTEHPNLVAVITEAHANGESATGLSAARAEGLPVASIDFGSSPAERGLEGIPEVTEGIPRSVGLVESKVNRVESNPELEKIPESSRIGKQGPKSLGQGLAPREGAEVRPVEVLADVEKPHDAFLEIGGGMVALGLVAWWGSEWYYSSQAAQSEASKPSTAVIPVTGAEP